MSAKQSVIIQRV